MSKTKTATKQETFSAHPEKSGPPYKWNAHTVCTNFSSMVIYNDKHFNASVLYAFHATKKRWYGSNEHEYKGSNTGCAGGGGYPSYSNEYKNNPGHELIETCILEELRALAKDFPKKHPSGKSNLPVLNAITAEIKKQEEILRAKLIENVISTKQSKPTTQALEPGIYVMNRMGKEWTGTVWEPGQQIKMTHYDEAKDFYMWHFVGNPGMGGGIKKKDFEKFFRLKSIVTIGTPPHDLSRCPNCGFYPGKCECGKEEPAPLLPGVYQCTKSHKTKFVSYVIGEKTFFNQAMINSMDENTLRNNWKRINDLPQLVSHPDFIRQTEVFRHDSKIFRYQITIALSEAGYQYSHTHTWLKPKGTEQITAYNKFYTTEFEAIKEAVNDIFTYAKSFEGLNKTATHLSSAIHTELKPLREWYDDLSKRTQQVKPATLDQQADKFVANRHDNHLPYKWDTLFSLKGKKLQCTIEIGYGAKEKLYAFKWQYEMPRPKGGSAGTGNARTDNFIHKSRRAAIESAVNSLIAEGKSKGNGETGSKRAIHWFGATFYESLMKLAAAQPEVQSNQSTPAGATMPLPTLVVSEAEPLKAAAGVENPLTQSDIITLQPASPWELELYETFEEMQAGHSPLTGVTIPDPPQPEPSAAVKSEIRNPQSAISEAYPGSKYGAGVVQRLINQIPPHDIFVSGCLGKCALLASKKPARTNYGIDPNLPALQAFWDDLSINNVKLYRQSFFDWIKGFTFSKGMVQRWFVYLDPPYRSSMRSTGKLYYDFEWTAQDHANLIAWAKETTALSNVMIAISHYPDPMYDELLATGWRKITYPVRTRRDTVDECLYMNYPEPEALHEYTYLGDNKITRQAHKRKLTGYLEKFKEMKPLERNAILAELQSQFDLPVRQAGLSTPPPQKIENE